MMFNLKSIAIGCLLLCGFIVFQACAQNKNQSKKISTKMDKMEQYAKDKKLSVATFGAGCFWCVETQLMQLQGVDTVVSGYSGGQVENPTYKDVCTGTTGHAEVCQVYFDTTKISFAELLKAFFVTHDPTQLNRQGNDEGTQYRSAIFYHDEFQKQESLKIIAELNAAKAYEQLIVTEVSAFTKFYPAEDYHQNYFNQNPEQAYCAYVIKPKKDKFEKVFKDRLKSKANSH
ncbi:MAG: peptide-methionine (S)-S-oxide reductase MsrA [Bacteroidota bacterium]|jgi:peptide-methionine (S)-S-oxide reductase